jgi:transcriptional regulator of arginine metabolism
MIRLDALCIFMHNYWEFMQHSGEHHQHERRDAILRLLRTGEVRRQSELTQLLRKNGFEATQSSISRDLRELGVLKASGRYLPPPEESSRAQGSFSVVAQFVRELKAAGPTLVVVKTTIGAAQSVAVAIDRGQWPEAVGTISGDDTIFIATTDVRARRRLLERLHASFGI